MAFRFKKLNLSNSFTKSPFYLLKRFINVICPVHYSGKTRRLVNTAPLLLNVNSLKKTFTNNNINQQIFSNISFKCLKGSKVAVVGVNGSGKSTLMRILTGEDRDYEGDVIFDKKAKISHLAQEPLFDKDKTIIENIKIALSPQLEILQKFNDIGMAYSDPNADYELLSKQQGELQDEIDRYNLWELESNIERAMQSIGLPDKNTLLKYLSGGEKRKVAFCITILSKSDVMLLDEPTNHLDMKAIVWLENYLKSYKGTVFIISHDRNFIDNFTEWILEIDAENAFIFQGNFSNWLEVKNSRLLEFKRLKEEKIKKAKKEIKALAQNKNSYNADSKKTEMKEYLRNMTDTKITNESLHEINLPPNPVLESGGIEVNNLTIKFDGRTIIDNMNVGFRSNSIVGIIGPNGSGKTTLFRSLVKELTPDKGRVIIDPSVKLGYVRQNRESLDPDSPVWYAICGSRTNITINSKRTMSSRHYVTQFLFRSSEQNKLVRHLSGGEKNRAYLAKVLLEGCNFLLLDEPTNDLDIVTMTALENSLKKFSGCVLCISHDRYFLHKVCTHILELDGKGNSRFFNGNFEFYNKMRKTKSI